MSTQLMPSITVSQGGKNTNRKSVNTFVHKMHQQLKKTFLS